MNPAAEIMVCGLEPGHIDFEEPRQAQSREQIKISGEWSPALRTDEVRFLDPREFERLLDVAPSIEPELRRLADERRAALHLAGTK